MVGLKKKERIFWQTAYNEIKKQQTWRKEEIFLKKGIDKLQISVIM